MADYCETYDDGSWACWYDDGSYQYADASGNTNVVNPSNPSVSVQDLINTGTQSALAILNRNGYQTPTGAYRGPTQTYNGSIPGIAASAGANKSGLGGSLNISTNTLLIGGLILFAFVFGKGRR